MLPRHRLPAAFALFALVVAACGPGEQAPAGTPTPSPPPPDAEAIRGLDLKRIPAVEALLLQLGAVDIDRDAIIYADLTGDRRDEAVIPIATGGTQGNTAYIVLALRSGTPQPVLTRVVDRSTRSGLKMTVEDGRLIETTGVYGPEDPLCCPTQLRVTYFRWDGSALQVEREETRPNPNPPRF